MDDNNLIAKVILYGISSILIFIALGLMLINQPIIYTIRGLDIDKNDPRYHTGEAHRVTGVYLLTVGIMILIFTIMSYLLKMTKMTDLVRGII